MLIRHMGLRIASAKTGTAKRVPDYRACAQQLRHDAFFRQIHKRPVGKTDKRVRERVITA